MAVGTTANRISAFYKATGKWFYPGPDWVNPGASVDNTPITPTGEVDWAATATVMANSMAETGQWKSPDKQYNYKTPPRDNSTDLNLLIRGQSNALLFYNYGGAAALKADLQTALGVTVNILAADNSTLFSSTRFMDWAVNGQRQKLLAYINSRPQDIQDNETITIWLHNEYDQQIVNLQTAAWVKAVREDAILVRGALNNQKPQTTPYLFVVVRYPYGGSLPAIQAGMDQLVADTNFKAAKTLDATTSEILMNGGPEAGNNSSHMGPADAVTIGHKLADDVIALYNAIG